MNQARVRSGMMFAAVPPSWMIPWTRAVGSSCWRHRPTDANSRIIASSAFLPFHGSDAACACSPVNDDLDVLRRERPAVDVVAVARVVQQGGVEALEQAVLDHDLLAAPPLLGRACRGRRSRPGSSSAMAARAIAAPTPDAAIVLWPQPWPRPGQRVVLGEDADPRAVAAAAAALTRPDGRREAAGRVLAPSNPWRASDLGDPGRRLVLLEGRLRVGVDPVRQVEDLVAGRLDGRGEPRLHRGVRFGRGRAGQRGHGSSEAERAGGAASGTIVPTASPGRRRRPVGGSALGGQRGLGDDDQGDHEQGDRQLQRALEPQDDEDA